jgi:hypothetical protein
VLPYRSGTDNDPRRTQDLAASTDAPGDARHSAGGLTAGLPDFAAGLQQRGDTLLGRRDEPVEVLRSVGEISGGHANPLDTDRSVDLFLVADRQSRQCLGAVVNRGDELRDISRIRY